MITSIRILITNGNNKKEYYIHYDKKVIYINGSYKEIKEEAIQNILRFFLTWEETNVSPSIIDGEEYLVEIVSSNNKNKYYGKGKFPKNYWNFKKYLEELI